mmetsp:Transcript_22111/g.66397  ORF Transcript_22111/g.66397 Transcript_22111/m.66397 type:complete len:234 (-) Transcript_22111:1358-2059(-)
MWVSNCNLGFSLIIYPMNRNPRSAMPRRRRSMVSTRWPLTTKSSCKSDTSVENWVTISRSHSKTAPAGTSPKPRTVLKFCSALSRAQSHAVATGSTPLHMSAAETGVSAFATMVRKGVSSLWHKAVKLPCSASIQDETVSPASLTNTGQHLRMTSQQLSSTRFSVRQNVCSRHQRTRCSRVAVPCSQPGGATRKSHSYLATSEYASPSCTMRTKWRAACAVWSAMASSSLRAC